MNNEEGILAELEQYKLADMARKNVSLANCEKLRHFIGKWVVYRRELLNKEFIEEHGTIALDGVFLIKSCRVGLDGSSVLIGYWHDGEYGREMDVDEIEVIADLDVEKYLAIEEANSQE